MPFSIVGILYDHNPTPRRVFGTTSSQASKHSGIRGSHCSLLSGDNSLHPATWHPPFSQRVVKAEGCTSCYLATGDRPCERWNSCRTRMSVGTARSSGNQNPTPSSIPRNSRWIDTSRSALVDFCLRPLVLAARRARSGWLLKRLVRPYQCLLYRARHRPTSQSPVQTGMLGVLCRIFGHYRAKATTMLVAGLMQEPIALQCFFPLKWKKWLRGWS